MKGKFRHIYGVITVFDAVTPKHYVSIVTDRDAQSSGAGTFSLTNVKQSSYSGAFPIPITFQVTWQAGVKLGWDQRRRWTGGTIVGDYTVPVAERIPDALLDEIRANGGALRLKIRLIDDGVLIGWDTEKRIPFKDSGPAATGRYLKYVMPGGDFREAQKSDGKIIERGWYIDKNGKKTWTDG